MHHHVIQKGKDRDHEELPALHGGAARRNDPRRPKAIHLPLQTEKVRQRAAHPRKQQVHHQPERGLQVLIGLINTCWIQTQRNCFFQKTRIGGFLIKKKFLQYIGDRGETKGFGPSRRVMGLPNSIKHLIWTSE